MWALEVLSMFSMYRMVKMGSRNLPKAFVRPNLLGLTLGDKVRSIGTQGSGQTLPIGYDNFRAVIDNKLNFIDKSLFIKEVLDDKATQTAVITRPRRFGKTLNLSMLHHFLAFETQGKPTAYLFDNLKIKKTASDYMQHQGKYPVIFMTFKDIQGETYEESYSGFKNLMGEAFEEHRYLLDSPRLYKENKLFFEQILTKTADAEDLKLSIKHLTRYLYAHHGTQPWLLIDEYDTPIQAAFVNNYYNKMMNMMRICLGAALKTNPYLNRAVITGILRIAKEGLFSGVNNLKAYSLLQNQYSQHFGFTEPEVIEILKQAHLEGQSQAVQEWYNGYQIGDTVVYNPWSMANYVQEQGELDAYWVNTSDNVLINKILTRSSPAIKEGFDELLKNQPIEKLIEQSMYFLDLEGSETAIWSLLLTSGYLKAQESFLTDQGLMCKLAIPNYEVKRLYKQIIERWLSGGHGERWYQNFISHLLKGDVELFKEKLETFIETTMSVHDVARDPEAFYHGLVLGLTAYLCENKNYVLRSNRESGKGRYDYLILSKNPKDFTILLEFKKVDLEKKEKPQEVGKTLKTEADQILAPNNEIIKKIKDIEEQAMLQQKKRDERLKISAKEGLQQMEAKHYVAEPLQYGSTNILEIALAFSGKQVEMEYKFHKPAAKLSKISP